MDGLLTFIEERNKGFGPVKGLIDSFVDALGYVWDRVGIGNALDLLMCLICLLDAL